MYEKRGEPLLASHRFRNRMLMHVIYALVLILLTLVLGALGHRWLGEHSWYDAIMNAAFIMGGLGAYALPESAYGKVFFALYGFFVALVVMATLGVVLAPIAHRIMHKFHLDDSDES